MLFQDPKRKKSPGQIHRIWWQTPFPEAEITTTMHNKVPCSKAKLSKNTLFHERTRKDKIFKHVQNFASSFLTLPGAPSSATLSDKWGRPKVQRSNMLFQDRKRKKSPGQLLPIWWQTPSLEAETTTMHSKVLYPNRKERSQAKNYLWTKYVRQPMYVVCFHLCSFKIIVYFSLLR